jgi:D-alanine--poly(phosphoribitol) ligase subunit 1
MQTNVIDYLEKGALTLCPQKLGLVDPNHRLAFSEIEQFAKNCAAAILDQAPSPNQPVAVFLPKSAPAVVADLGVLYSGNCYANLDVKSPPQRLKAILENLGASVIVTDGARAAALTALGVADSRLILIEQAMVSQKAYDESVLRGQRDHVLDTDPVYIMYTSGSTGVPKGVVIPHRGVIDYIDWAKDCYRFGEEEIIGNQAPLFFDNSTLDLYASFSCGATLVLIPEELFGFPKKLIEYITQAKITTIFWVPSVLSNVANAKVLDQVALPKLGKILFAGEVMPARTLNHWRKRFPQALFSNLYGPTEITVDCTYYIFEREFGDEEKLPIGFACRNSDVLILNEHHQPAAVDEPGELCVRGSSLALGYWNNPERTAQAFVQNPLNPHYPERIYRTGDLVSRNRRGEILFIGRKDFQIKHLGYRIELGEIEHAVLQVEGVHDGCVVYDQGRKEIALFYESGEELEAGFIRKQLGACVPKYMLPTVFRHLQALPRTPNGKINRHQLAASLS